MRGLVRNDLVAKKRNDVNDEYNQSEDNANIMIKRK